MHGRQAGDEGEDGGEAAVDEGDRHGLTRADATGEGEVRARIASCVRRVH